MFRGPVEIELRFTEAVNVISDPPLPARIVIGPNSESKVVTVKVADSRMGFSFRLGMSHVPGAPLPVPEHNIVLYPPFPSGHTYFVSQGVEGRHTHTDSQSEFAVDISMPVGTPVLAAESGIVMDIEEDFNKGGTDREKFATRANHVRLLHDDGTMSNYGHLDYNSVVVGLGQRVVAGTLIGRSGNTGFSTGPHLHFSVQRNLGMNLQGIPFEFRTTSGELMLPIGGQLISGTLASR
jgi:murein DD-endopeptidase MepM/ murein hydrolase activator NlpD